MERLTERTELGSLVQKGYTSTRQLIDKMGYYEDLEDAGRLFILPAGIGAPVYVIETCTCGLHYNCNNKQADKRKRAIKVVPDKETPKARYCKKIFERPFKIEYLNKIGKSVFLSFEDAEKNLLPPF